MDLIGTILVGPREENLEKAIKSLHDCGCEAIHAHVDLIEPTAYAILNKYNCKIFERVWDWWGSARNYLQGTIPQGTKWEIFLDADDEIPEETCKYIKEIKKESPLKVIYLPYVYLNKKGQIYGKHYRARIFPPDKLTKWYMRVHEVPIFVGIPNEFQTYPIYHRRHDKESNRNNKYIAGLLLDLQENPEDPRIYHYLGQSYFDDGQIDKAIEYYEKYLQKGGYQEERAVACIQLSNLYLSKKNTNKALEYARKADLETNEPRREINSQIAYCLELQGKISQAFTVLNEALSIPYPKASLLWINVPLYNIDIHFQIVTLLDKHGQTKTALEYANKALEIEPNNSNMLYNKQIFMERLQLDIPRIKRRKPMAFFYMGASLEDWNADIVNTGGIGGLESANVNMAKEFIKRDWDVILFTNCKDKEGIFNGIQHKDYRRVQECIEFFKPDIIFSSRRYEVGAWKNKAYKVLWNHDLHYGNDPQIAELMNGFDEIIFQSPFAYSVMKQAYGISEDKVYLTRLGINMDDFKHDIPKERRHCIYASSPDRGLVRLLGFWKDIKARVPEATLDVFYGFNNMLNVAKLHSPQAYENAKKNVDNLVKLMEETPGVSYKGRIGHAELAKEFLKAAIWTYPTKFLETLCITALSACAGGAIPVTSDIGALNTTVGEYGIMLNEDADSPEYSERFVNEVVKLMTDDEYYQQWQAKAKDNIWTRKNNAGKAYWSWEAIGGEWVEHFEARIKGKILEIGCGHSPNMNHENIMHSDMCEGSHLELYMNNEAIPFKDDTLEGMIAHQTLEHTGWRDVVPALEKIWDAMKPGAYFELSVPRFMSFVKELMNGQKNVYWFTNCLMASQSTPGNIHKNNFLPSSLRSTLARAGFAVTEIQLAPNSIRAICQKPRTNDKHWYEKLLSDKFGKPISYDMLGKKGEWVDGWTFGVPWAYDTWQYVSGKAKDNTTLDIVVIAHGRCKERTLPCLTQLRNIVGDKPYNIIGVNDGSKDETAQVMKELCDITVNFPERRGMTEANNAGIYVSKSPYICFMQNDISVVEGTLEGMINTLATKTNIGIVSPRSDRYNGLAKWENGIMEYSYIATSDYLNQRFPFGPCMAMRKADLIEAGMFDPFNYNSGIDHDIGGAMHDLGLSMGILEKFPCKIIDNESTLAGIKYNERDAIRLLLNLYYLFLKYNYSFNNDFWKCFTKFWERVKDGIHI